VATVAATGSRARRSRRPLALFTLLVLLALGLFGWRLTENVLAVSHALNASRAQFATAAAAAQDGDLTALDAAVHELAASSAAARRATSGPAWSVAAAFPGVGKSFKLARGLAVAADQLAAEAAPPLLSAAASIQPKTIIGTGGVVNVSWIRRASTSLDQAAKGLAEARRTVGALPDSGVPAELAKARTLLLNKLKAASDRLAALQTAAVLAPSMLGGGGDRLYVLAFHGAAAAMTPGARPEIDGRLEARNGKVKLAIDPRWIANGPTEQVDGVVSIDAQTLSYILEATGPVTLLDGTVMTSDNAVAQMTTEAVNRFPYGPLRTIYLGSSAVKVINAALNEGLDNPRELVSALDRAAAAGHLHVTTPAHPAEQSLLSSTEFGS
jgi:hypothetical protein